MKKNAQVLRRAERLDAIARSAPDRRARGPGEKLDIADNLIRDARSLHDAAKGTVARRRR